jgi:YVTN family beta-propeller protein
MTVKRFLQISTFTVVGAYTPFVLMQAQEPTTPPAGAPPAAADGQPAPVRKKGPPRPPRPGVSTPGVKREMSTITPQAEFPTGGTPDWQVLTEDALWVSNGPTNTVHRLDIKTNTIAANVAVGKRPCSGLAAGFGSIWVPNCGDKTMSRIDVKTNEVVATIPVGPADSEGGVCTSEDAVWMITDPAGKLSRIDPKTNQVVATVDIPAASASVVYGDGAVWVTSPKANMLTRVDAKSNQVTDSIETGPGPRFATFGGGAIWTLNQGDGTVSRVDVKTRKVVANIELGLPGTGGEIAYGLGHVWATVFQIPISEIDPATNTVIRQWVGAGGDSIRAGHGSVWLSNLREKNVWRIDPSKF